jgi:hypothetical protein
LRNTAARTEDALWQATGRLCVTMLPSQCANYLKHCGYAVQRIAPATSEALAH